MLRLYEILHYRTYNIILIDAYPITEQRLILLFFNHRMDFVFVTPQYIERSINTLTIKSKIN